MIINIRKMIKVVVCTWLISFSSLSTAFDVNHQGNLLNIKEIKTTDKQKANDLEQIIKETKADSDWKPLQSYQGKKDQFTYKLRGYSNGNKTYGFLTINNGTDTYHYSGEYYYGKVLYDEPVLVIKSTNLEVTYRTIINRETGEELIVKWDHSTKSIYEKITSQHFYFLAGFGICPIKNTRPVVQCIDEEIFSKLKEKYNDLYPINNQIGLGTLNFYISSGGKDKNIFFSLDADMKDYLSKQILPIINQEYLLFSEDNKSGFSNTLLLAIGVSKLFPNLNYDFSRYELSKRYKLSEGEYEIYQDYWREAQYLQGKGFPLDVLKAKEKEMEGALLECIEKIDPIKPPPSTKNSSHSGAPFFFDGNPYATQLQKLENICITILETMKLPTLENELIAQKSGKPETILRLKAEKAYEKAYLIKKYYHLESSQIPVMGGSYFYIPLTLEVEHAVSSGFTVFLEEQRAKNNDKNFDGIQNQFFGSYHAYRDSLRKFTQENYLTKEQ